MNSHGAVHISVARAAAQNQWLGVTAMLRSERQRAQVDCITGQLKVDREGILMPSLRPL